MSITLYHLEKSRSRRVMLLLEELELDYDIENYKRDPKTFRAPLSLQKIHPLGKVPLVKDGDRILAETGAIFEELLETYGNGRFVPERGTEAMTQYRYFMHYAEASLMPPLLVRLIFDMVGSSKVPFFIKPIIKGLVKQVEGSYINKELTLQTNYLNGLLGQRKWFAGDAYTAADMMMSYPVEALLERGRMSEASTVNLRDWSKRVKARPAYQRALDRGAGPVV